MGHNDHIDFELYELVQDVIDAGLLEEGTAGYGIALQAVDTGYKGLSEKQRHVFDSVVMPALKKRAREIELEQNRDLMRRD